MIVIPAANIQRTIGAALILGIILAAVLLMPMTVAAQVTCPGGLPPRLSVGMMAAVTPGLPNTLWDNWTRIKNKIGSMPAGSPMIVVGGPECRNRITWWQVLSVADDKIGWTGEGRGGGYYWLEPIPGTIQRYQSEAGGGSMEQVLTPTDETLTCLDIARVAHQLIRGDTLFLYMASGGGGVTSITDADNYWLWLEDAAVTLSSGWAFRMDEAFAACPGLFDPHTGQPAIFGALIDDDAGAVLMLTHSQENSTSPTLPLTFEVAVPRFELIVKPAGIDGFNDLIAAFVADEKAKMEEAVSENAPGPGAPDAESSLWIEYRIIGTSTRMISVLIMRNSYLVGAAHPSGVTHRAINYELATGREYALAELFLADADYLTALADYANSTIDSDLLFEPIAATAENFHHWAIGPNGLHIAFDTYQVAPYAAGPIHIVIPYQVLQELLSPIGPAANFTDDVAAPLGG